MSSINTTIYVIGVRTMTNITLSLLRQCNCSWRSILAIAPNIATMSRAESKGEREREKERDKRKEKTLTFISCTCHSI